MSDNPLAHLFVPPAPNEQDIRYRIRGPHVSRVLFPGAPTSNLAESPAVPQPATVQQPRRTERVARRASCPNMAMNADDSDEDTVIAGDENTSTASDESTTTASDESTVTASDEEAHITLPRRMAEISLGDLESYDLPENTMFHSYPSGLPVPVLGYHGYTSVAEPGTLSEVVDNMDYGTIDTPTRPPKRKAVRFAVDDHQLDDNRMMGEASSMAQALEVNEEPKADEYQQADDYTTGSMPGDLWDTTAADFWGSPVEDPWANVVEDPYVDAHYDMMHGEDTGDNDSQRTISDKKNESPAVEPAKDTSNEPEPSATATQSSASVTPSAAKASVNSQEEQQDVNGETDNDDSFHTALSYQEPQKSAPVPSLRRMAKARKARSAKKVDADEDFPIDKYSRIGSSKGGLFAVDKIASYNRDYADARSAAYNLRVHLASTNNTFGNAANAAEASRAAAARPQGQAAPGSTSASFTLAAPRSPAAPGYSPSAAGTMDAGPPIFGARHPGIIPAWATGNPASPGDPFVDAGSTPGRGRMAPSPSAGRGSAKRSHNEMAGTTSMAGRDAARERELGQAPSGFVVGGPARAPFQGNNAGSQRRRQGLSDSPYGVRKMAKRDGQEDEEMDMGE
ncbi:hypothetical protein F5X68DRAFT_253217 [Plectosphaerella plurivora]|uniref:Uncharacterized protein n=1 Tax=Plectosphaerella plurivora TaxID=936078 RepID=A0A9P9AC92_9PEZI|nr:hypothetical protein F5X68DRAFT_253217 [Plectosphaerella plurivora]